MTRLDESAGLEQFIRHWPQVMAHVQFLVPSPEDAADLLQDVSLTVLLHGGAPVDPARFIPWCWGVARNLALHHRRAARRQGEVFEPLDAGLEVADPAAFHSAEQNFVDRDSIAKCLQSLDRRSRRLLLLRYVAGETPEEIARHLHQSPAAVRTKLLRVRDRFCGQLRKAVGTDPF